MYFEVFLKISRWWVLCKRNFKNYRRIEIKGASSTLYLYAYISNGKYFCPVLISIMSLRIHFVTTFEEIYWWTLFLQFSFYIFRFKKCSQTKYLRLIWVQWMALHFLSVTNSVQKSNAKGKPQTRNRANTHL